MDLYNGLQASELDRSILFPLLLTGFLTDDLLYHDILKQRLALHGTDAVFNGPMAQASHLLEYVWQGRATQRSLVPVNSRHISRRLPHFLHQLNRRFLMIRLARYDTTMARHVHYDRFRRRTRCGAASAPSVILVVASHLCLLPQVICSPWFACIHRD